MWTQQLDRGARDASRSVLRGIGPARQAAEFELFALLVQVPLDLDDPVTRSGPTGPGRMLCAGTFWVLREIELSFAKVRHISIAPDGSVSWDLPVSKTDPAAIGCTRSWACVCAALYGACGACAVKRQLVFLQKTFMLPDGTLPPDLPLFPTASGATPSKQSVVSTIEEAAHRSGAARLDSHGYRLFSGGLRVAGHLGGPGQGLTGRRRFRTG